MYSKHLQEMMSQWSAARGGWKHGDVFIRLRGRFQTAHATVVLGVVGLPRPVHVVRAPRLVLEPQEARRAGSWPEHPEIRRL